MQYRPSREVDYHKTDIHRRMLRNIALNVELIYNDKDDEISEYDVQAFLSLFLRRNLKNTKFSVARESFGKFDCAISREHKSAPVVLYELKTYLKPREQLNTSTQYKKIVRDLCKLSKGIQTQEARGYFLLACRVNQLTDLSKFEFIKHALDGKKTWAQLAIPNCESKIKLRPSAKEVSIGRVRVFSWEVKAT